MPILVNLRHLELDELHLQGELSAAEMDIDTKDEMVQFHGSFAYDLEVQKLEEGILSQGHLRVELECQCVRCLKPFLRELELPAWALHLPLVGEDAVSVSNDCVDLTPYLREDILLELPQHPLCSEECRGLPSTYVGRANTNSGAGQTKAGSPAWDELNKLKL